MANEMMQQRSDITAYLNRDDVKRQLNQAVGKNAARFVSSVVSAVTVNPELQKCSNTSILSGALLGESLNLSPSRSLGIITWSRITIKRRASRLRSSRWGIRDISSLQSVPASTGR